MNSSTHCLLILSLIFALTAQSYGAACVEVSATQRLRSTVQNQINDDSDQQLPQIDLSQLSEQQLQQLMQQLHVADQLDDEDKRGSSRPWKKIQRIIRRQLIRVPKRYLKKFLRQFGLARSASVRSGSSRADIQLYPVEKPETELYYLIPLE